MGTFYDAPNDYRTILHRECLESGSNYLCHHGVKGMHWGQRKDYIPHPRLRKAGMTPFTKLLTSGYERRVNRKKSQNHTLVAKRTELGKRHSQILDDAHKRFDNDKKYKSSVINYIAKKGTPDAKYWANTLKSKEVHDRYPENLTDAIYEYESHNNQEFIDLNEQLRSINEEYNRKIYR